MYSFHQLTILWFICLVSERRNSRGKDRLFVRQGNPTFDFFVGLYEGDGIKEVSLYNVFLKVIASFCLTQTIRVSELRTSENKSSWWSSVREDLTWDLWIASPAF